MSTTGLLIEIEQAAAAGGGNSLQLMVHLDEPQQRLSVRGARVLGRAEAHFDVHCWAAKHHWAEGADEARVTVYEFDEPIPAGDVKLVIPFG